MIVPYLAREHAPSCCRDTVLRHPRTVNIKTLKATPVGRIYLRGGCFKRNVSLQTDLIDIKFPQCMILAYWGYHAISSP